MGNGAKECGSRHEKVKEDLKGLVCGADRNQWEGFPWVSREFPLRLMYKRSTVHGENS